MKFQLNGDGDIGQLERDHFYKFKDTFVCFIK